jgi:hypothetical protein
VARSSGFASSAVSFQRGCRARAERPRDITWSSVSTSPPFAPLSKEMTCFSPATRERIAVTFSSWCLVDTKIATAPESHSVYSTCFAGSVG